MEDDGEKVKEFVKSDSHYVNRGFSLSGGGWKLYFPYQFSYIPLKKDGSEGKPKKIVASIYPTFCAFCGQKLVEDDGDTKEENKKDS